MAYQHTMKHASVTECLTKFSPAEQNLINQIVDQMAQLVQPDNLAYFGERQRLLLMKCMRNKHAILLQEGYMAHGDLVNLLIYVERLAKVPSHKYLLPDNKNHILLALILLYIKMYDDTYYTNTYYSVWTQINVESLNRTEFRLFSCLELYITPEEFIQKEEELMMNDMSEMTLIPPLLLEDRHLTLETGSTYGSTFGSTCGSHPSGWTDEWRIAGRNRRFRPTICVGSP